MSSESLVVRKVVLLKKIRFKLLWSHGKWILSPFPHMRNEGPELRREGGGGVEGTSWTERKSPVKEEKVRWSLRGRRRVCKEPLVPH